MSLRAKLRSWWKGLAQRTRTESELESELNFHMEASAEDLMRHGMSREEALRRLRLELGSSVAHKENWRSAVGLRLWDDLHADLRYAARQLRRSPAFTVTVLVVLALGIGANAAMFSIVDATLLRWLPYSHPNELMSLATRDSKGTPAWKSFADIEVWQQRSQTLASLGYYNPIGVYLKSPAGDQFVSAPLVSSNIFSVLGVPPMMGRGFVADEQVPGRGKVVVLGETVWRNMFQGDPNIVGKQVSLNDVPHTVIGVMPPRFVFPADDTVPQIWVPIAITEKHHVRDFSTPPYQAIARVRNDRGRAAAAAELTTIQQGLAPLYQHLTGNGLAPSQVELTPYRDSLTKDSRGALIALLAAVVVIWLIACANVANLMLARGMARQREIAVRGALGASRWRVVRQLFTESLVLSVAGATAGLALAQIALHVFSRTLSTRLNLPEHLAPNLPVLGALLVLTVLSALLFGLLPAWLAARTPLEQSLRQGTAQAGASRNRHRLQKAIVAAEIGLSMVLLISCGLLLRTVFALRHVPLGFRTEHVLIVQPKLPRYKYRGQDINRAVYKPLLERVQQMNGVMSASLTTIVPLHKGFDPEITLYVGHGEKSTAPPTRIDAKLKAAGPELKDVLGFRMYQGRFFTDQDTADSRPVAVVNRAFARLFSPNGEIIDKFSVGLDKDRQATIVGVMDDFHQTAIDEPSVPEIDFCTNQMRPTDGFYQPVLQVHVELAIRTARDPEQLIPDLRRAMAGLNPDLKDSSFLTMNQVVEDAMGSQLLAAHLLELFAGAALLVALAGLYGLLTYLVTQRTQELGVRLALGAQRPDIVRMLLKQAFWLLVTGAAIGVTLAYVSGRLLAGFLYGVKPGDLWTLSAVTALLMLCGLLAAYVPSRRASRIDPLQALRES